MQKSKVYIPVSVETPPEKRELSFSEDFFLIDRIGDLCTGYYRFNTNDFIVYNNNGQVPTHWLQPVERYVLEEDAMQNILSDKNHHDLLIECCNKIIDGTDNGNIPGRHLAGLKILLGRPNKK